MPGFDRLIAWMKASPDFSAWGEKLPEQLARGLSSERWGDLPRWQAAIDRLPDLMPSVLDFSAAATIGATSDCTSEIRDQLRECLMELHPWRKGPWSLFGLDIDTEWRSDWKWNRIAPHLAPLENRTVLDVGCGNGYHCFRLYGAGAKRVIGVDPSAKFVCQFLALKKYCPELPVDVLPLGIEAVPPYLRCFDTVLSMGVIYHRRDPLAHLQELANCGRPGGQIVLETLVVEAGHNLIPEGRYTKMRNVWCVPCPDQVLHWMAEIGLKEPRMVDISATTTDEQRRTQWMCFESLADFLDPDNSALTIEGYPAPVRAVFTATI